MARRLQSSFDGNYTPGFGSAAGKGMGAILLTIILLITALLAGILTMNAFSDQRDQSPQSERSGR